MITIEKQRNRKPKKTTYETATRSHRSQVKSNRHKGHQQSCITDNRRQRVGNRTESISSRALYPNTKRPARHRRQQIPEQQREIATRKQLLRRKRRQELDVIRRTDTKPVNRKDQSRQLPFDRSAPGIMIFFSFLMGSVTMLLHGLDLAFGWPFHRTSIIYDIVFVLAGVILSGMTWSVWREREKTRKW